MRYAKLRNELLNAREKRWEELQMLCAALPGGTLIQLALNLPGSDKHPAGSDELIAWGEGQLQKAFPQLSLELFGGDALGAWSLYYLPQAPSLVKRICCRIEARRDYTRLLDLDVYDRTGRIWDRQRLGLPQRRCLICDAEARECIRAGRHTPVDLTGRRDELLEPFAAYAAGRLSARRAQG